MAHMSLHSLSFEQVKDLVKDEKFRTRFFSKVKKTDACWIWTAALNTTGYGWFTVNRVTGPVRAHQVAWMLDKGEVLEKPLVLRHKCDNTKCCNPKHLETGTQRENAADSVRRRRISNNGASKYRGVSWHKQAKKWRAYIALGGKQRSLGLFNTQEEAAKAFAEAASQV